MSLDPSKRSEQVMIYEGQAINVAGQFGKDAGAYNARCCVDGSMNALVRIVGREEAAQYALAMSDRICGGLREPTEFPPKLIAAPVPVVITPADADKPKRRAMRFYTIFVVGWLCGFYVGWSVRT